MHDGAIVKVLEGRHVLHPSDAAVVHGLHLLSGECILLVGVHLNQKTDKHGPDSLNQHHILNITTLATHGSVWQ